MRLLKFGHLEQCCHHCCMPTVLFRFSYQYKSRKRGCFCRDVSVTGIQMSPSCHPLNIFLVSIVRYSSVRLLTDFSFLFALHRIESKISRIMPVNPHRQVKLCIIISLNRPLKKRCNITFISFHIFFLVLWDLMFSVPAISFSIMQTKHTVPRPMSSCLPLNP
jgi:hypothetical protein